MSLTPSKHERSTVLYSNATTATITVGTLVELNTGYVGVALVDIAASGTGELAFCCDVTVAKNVCPAIVNGGKANIASDGTIYDSANTSSTTIINARAHAAAASAATTITLGIW